MPLGKTNNPEGINQYTQDSKLNIQSSVSGFFNRAKNTLSKTSNKIAYGSIGATYRNVEESIKSNKWRAMDSAVGALQGATGPVGAAIIGAASIYKLNKNDKELLNRKPTSEINNSYKTMKNEQAISSKYFEKALSSKNPSQSDWNKFHQHNMKAETAYQKTLEASKAADNAIKRSQLIPTLKFVGKATLAGAAIGGVVGAIQGSDREKAREKDLLETAVRRNKLRKS